MLSEVLWATAQDAADLREDELWAKQHEVAIESARLVTPEEPKVSMDQLAPQLSSGDWRVRRDTLQLIAESPHLLQDPDARFELAGLVAALGGDSFWQVREAISHTLCQLCAENPTVRLPGRETLTILARDWHAEVVIAAVHALLGAHASLPETFEAVAAASTERREEKVHAAGIATFEAIASKGGADRLAVALADRLHHEDADTRERAVEALALLDQLSSGSVLTAVTGQLKHAEGHVRVAAVMALREAHFNLAGTVEALLLAACDNDGRVRNAAGQTILELVSGAWTTQLAAARITLVQGIIEHLRNDDPAVRATAIDMLGQIAAPGHVAASAALADCLEDIDNDLRHRAAAALKTVVRPGDAEALLSVANRMGNPNEQVREAARTTLHHVAADHDTYTVALVSQHLGSLDPNVRQSAAIELDSIQMYADTISVQKVLDLLGHENDGVRSDAVRMLCKLELTKTNLHIEKLVKIHAAMSRPHERQAALEVLGCITSPGDEAVRDCLIARLDDDVLGVRAAACSALANIYQGDEVAVANLAQRLPQRAGAVRASMLDALRAVAKEGDEVAAIAAVSGLADLDASVRSVAVEVLGYLCAGHGSLAVKAAVVKCLDFASPVVRKSAVEGLIAVAGRSSGDKDATRLVAEVLQFAQSWGIRRTAADALLGIATAGNERGIMSSISKLVESRDEQLWQSNLLVVLASLRPVMVEPGDLGG